MSIAPNDPRLTAYVLGELDDQERLAIEDAIAASPELQGNVDELGAACDALTGALGGEQIELLDHAQRAAVLNEASRPASSARSHWSAPMALAASLALVASVALMYTALPRDAAALRTAELGLRDGDRNPVSSDRHLDDSLHARGEGNDQSRIQHLDALFDQALEARKNRNYTSAANSLNEVLTLDPGNERALWMKDDLSDVYPVARSRGSAMERDEENRLGVRAYRNTDALVGDPVAQTDESKDWESSRFAFHRPVDDIELRRIERIVQQLGASGMESGGANCVVIEPSHLTPEELRDFIQGLSPSRARPLRTQALADNETTIDMGARFVGYATDGDGYADHDAADTATEASERIRSLQSLGYGAPYVEATRPTYAAIRENAFEPIEDAPLSTFSIDVDTASYTIMRRYLKAGQFPPPSAVRIEELINFFTYDYDEPDEDKVFSVTADVADCPWQPDNLLVRVGLQGYAVAAHERPDCNLVFLVDVSGSMSSARKLPLVKESLKMLVAELDAHDRVALVTYAGQAGIALEPTPADEKDTILAAIDALGAGGSTHGSEGIKTAYALAAEHFDSEGVNRVILATDGDFNVGVVDRSELLALISEQAGGGVFLTVLGYGMGFNDATLETLADHGNGHYAYIDSREEAQRVLLDQLTGTLVTIAKDVKVQVEFNPQQVAGYRLIGYENRILAAQDFANDAKDAGEVGAGHAVTALYEITLRDEGAEVPVVTAPEETTLHFTAERPSDDLLRVALRYKPHDGDTSSLVAQTAADAGLTIDAVDADFRFAAAVASFGMLLRGSVHAGDASFEDVLALASGAAGDDPDRTAFLDLVERAIDISDPDGR